MPIATQIHPISTSLSASGADLLALPVGADSDGPDLSATVADHDRAALEDRLPVPLAELAGFYEVTGKAGQIREFPADLGGGLVRVALLGVGSATPADLRAAGAALARHARGRDRVATTVPGVLAGEDVAAETRSAALAAFVEGALLASYTFTLAAKPDGARPAPVIDLITSTPQAIEEPVRKGRALAEAAALARDLTNEPASEKIPQWLAERAADVATEVGLGVEVWDADALARDGFGAILAVGHGSPRPPRLVRLSYDPPGASRHVVLVGKGITFDTGGLSLKPTDNMKQMKTDMAGAAVVLAVMSRLGALDAPVRVTGLLPIAENAFSERAQRPSDVITTYNGTTVEVLNTDAEGRLVLADAMAYAVAELEPDALVDIATLTGAAKIALGTGTGALYANDDALAGALLESSTAVGEPMWRMPLVEDYTATLESPVADLANIGTSAEFGRPGATEAALFLRAFAGKGPWAHLDVAGPARSTRNSGVATKGATGFGTRLLLRWLAA